MKRIGVDVGGTFTDLVLWDDDGTVVVHKTPSTNHDPSIGTMDGIKILAERAGIDPSEIDMFFHGTTVATNIVLEHNGCDVGMITTEGFRDLLHIARKKRPLNYSNYQDLPWQKWQLVPRRNRRVVPERIDAAGNILTPLDEDAVREQVRLLRERGVQAIAVAFLHAYRNPTHEQRVRAIIEEEFPGVFISLSSEVAPQYREYERFSTAALNALRQHVWPNGYDELKSTVKSLALVALEEEILPEAIKKTIRIKEILKKGEARTINEAVEMVGQYVKWGLNHLVFHDPRHDQRRFLELFQKDLEPRLRRLG